MAKRAGSMLAVIQQYREKNPDAKAKEIEEHLQKKGLTPGKGYVNTALSNLRKKDRSPATTSAIEAKPEAATNTAKQIRRSEQPSDKVPLAAIGQVKALLQQTDAETLKRLIDVLD